MPSNSIAMWMTCHIALWSIKFMYFIPQLPTSLTIKLHKCCSPLRWRFHPFLISYQKNLTWSRSDRTLSLSLSREASSSFSKLWQPKGAVTFTQGFSRAPGFYNQTLQLFSHTALTVTLTWVACGSWRGSSLSQSPWRAIPYIFWPNVNSDEEEKTSLVPSAPGVPRGFQPGWMKGWLRPEWLLFLLPSNFVVWCGDLTLQ